MMVQEIIPGPPHAEYTIWGYLDRCAQVNVVIVTQTVRKPQMFANACVIRSVPRGVTRAFERVLFPYFQRIQYRGLFGAECKWDARDQCFKLLEVNARSMSGNEMALASGVNHILAAYWDVLGHPMAPQFHYRTGVHLIHALNDLPVLLHRGLHRELQLQDLRAYGGRKHWFAGSLRDPLPWLRAVRSAIPRLGRALSA
jgi:predicted ATP-grasp superfamily ATP-dependent carboligase